MLQGSVCRGKDARRGRASGKVTVLGRRSLRFGPAVRRIQEGSEFWASKPKAEIVINLHPLAKALRA